MWSSYVQVRIAGDVHKTNFLLPLHFPPASSSNSNISSPSFSTYFLPTCLHFQTLTTRCIFSSSSYLVYFVFLFLSSNYLSFSYSSSYSSSFSSSNYSSSLLTSTHQCQFWPYYVNPFLFTGVTCGKRHFILVWHGLMARLFFFINRNFNILPPFAA